MSRQRRTRYTVTLATGEQKVILAYSPTGARQYYEDRGLPTAAVRKGDANKETRIREVRSQGLPGRPSHEGIAAVAKALGITRPVRVTLNSNKSLTFGTHVPDYGTNYRSALMNLSADAFTHHIRVKSWLPAEQMRATLMHELTHAAQYEREVLPHASNAQEAVELRKRIYFDGTSYRAKRWEREARAAEQDAVRYPGLAR
jgi:hypothetical protein